MKLKPQDYLRWLPIGTGAMPRPHMWLTRSFRSLFRTDNLPVYAQRKLDRPWLVGLDRQILQARCGVRINIVRMVKEVEEVCRESNLGSLFDLEVLVERNVRIPGAGPKKISSLTIIEKISNWGVANRSICQCQRYLVVEIRSELAQHSLVLVSRNQRCQVTAGDIGCQIGIEGAAEPESLPPAVKGQLRTLILLQAGITKLIETGTRTEPHTTA